MTPEEAARDVSEERFADLLSGHCLLPAATLAELSGFSDRSNFRSGLVERVEAAWETPMLSLRCRQVRVLVGQKFGLEWLARPVALFVRLYPRVDCEYYSGDLTVVSILALREIMAFAPVEAAPLLDADYRWLDRDFADDRVGLWKEARSVLTEMRAARAAGWDPGSRPVISSHYPSRDYGTGHAG